VRSLRLSTHVISSADRLSPEESRHSATPASIAGVRGARTAVAVSWTRLFDLRE
jgi:hypothetical protein